ncbi:MAG TPA: hypothetical protein VFX61_09545 [Micromonosporaceae bacterium]|nr:hypothetical protein [Micromonosporaceae bacterium]
MATVPAQRTVPGQVAPAPVGPQPPRSRRYLRPILTVLGGVLALLCLGGIGVAYVAYDGATAPDRSAPDVVVDNYLRALLVDRNDAQANLYVCKGSPDLAEVRALRADLDDREERFSIRIHVTWGSLKVEPAASGKRVTTDIARTIADGSEHSRETWRFEVVDQDGWRVCGASRAD